MNNQYCGALCAPQYQHGNKITLKNIKSIINNASHRKWPISNLKWRYYQQWNNALFLHWRVDKNVLEEHIPSYIQADTINDECWVSLVAFTMQQIRPRYLPSWKFISDFHEINIRTYVVRDNKPGVFFLHIESAKTLSTFIANKVSGLPYQHANIIRSNLLDHQTIKSINYTSNTSLNADFSIKETIASKRNVDEWLTERYCLYGAKKNKAFRYEIHHKPWPLYHIEINQLEFQYPLNNLILNKHPDIAHYSPGVEVIAWGKEYL
jgi:uncharacterized protein YqjF (DUF2071 family)